MTLQLAMQWFPQCFAGSTLQRFRVPVPWEEGELPARVQQYLTSTWRAADMPLADFLRRTTGSGAIHRAFRTRYKELLAENADGAQSLESLEEWVNYAPLRGDVAVAAIYLSRYNDRYYGQWVLMNVPFTSLDDLRRPELDLVPPHLYYQTLAYLLRPEHWTSEEAVRAELELEAFREHHVRNILAMLSANQGLIRKYLSGELDKRDDIPSGAQGAQAVAGGTVLALSSQQLRIAGELEEAVQHGMGQRTLRENSWKGADPESDDPADADSERPHWGVSSASAAANPFAGVADGRSAYAVLGPAGSGKTTAVHALSRATVGFF